MVHGFGVEHLAVILIFGPAVLAVLGWILLEALKIVFGHEDRKKPGRFSADETRIIQEIHQGLRKMEKRIEAVETLVLDRAAREDEWAER